MGQAKLRGTFEQRKTESEFYASEQERLDEWLKGRRPRVELVNSHGELVSYGSINRLHHLLAWAVTTSRHINIYGH